jgi:hypothetical protein
MSKKKFPKLFRRRWLNRDKGSAYVFVDAQVSLIDWGRRKGGTEVDATLELKDCNRQICLEFYYHSEKTYKQRLKKIADLKKDIEDLEAFMIANPPTKAPEKEEEKVVKQTKAKKAPRKPVEPLPELLLTERHPDPPSLTGTSVEPLRKPKIIDIGPVKLTPAFSK